MIVYEHWNVDEVIAEDISIWVCAVAHVKTCYEFASTHWGGKTAVGEEIIKYLYRE